MYFKGVAILRKREVRETGKENYMFDVKQELPKAPLYREEFEHDNCGIGACVNIHGEKSRATVENALKIVENLEHAWSIPESHSCQD